MRRPTVVLPLVALAVLTGCGDSSAVAARSSGPHSPQAAVERFLDVMSPPAGASGPGDGPRDFWRRVCDTVEPRLRTLRFDASDPDKRASCGATVTLLTLGTHENSDVPSASGIFGTVRNAHTNGAESVVTVAVRYRPTNGAAGTINAATVKVLTVKRSGVWWLATPQALNPEFATRGGLTEPELATVYRQLLRAAGR
jgi:hypothetical protein